MFKFSIIYSLYFLNLTVAFGANDLQVFETKVSSFDAEESVAKDGIDELALFGALDAFKELLE